MVHPYTPYCPTFGYVGRHAYFLTFVTFERIVLFTRAEDVELVWAQFVRAAREQQFEVIVCGFMPDHTHLVVDGRTDDSDLKKFVKAAKQYSGFCYASAHDGARLWQKGFNDRIIRNRDELAGRVRYVLDNPVAAGLVERSEDYPYSRFRTTDRMIRGGKRSPG